ncbi:MAG: NAD(P)-dependent glycerol-3-phosphate dehydrogenase [Clostridia bacterium]|nr:NAD(P)-dependent glycerol-3-phosphate dehydrogenase [Clostridia bacterium]
MARISVLGDGSWACALAQNLSKNNHEVLLCGIDEERIGMINEGRSFYFPDIQLSKKIRGTTSLEQVALFSDDILIALPSHAIWDTLEKLNKYITRPKTFINASKGLEPHSLMRISEVVYESIDIDNIKGYVLLTGPSHAEEVIAGGLTSIASISYNAKEAQRIQVMFSTNTLRIYTNNDLVGGELCGAMKNAMAIGAGILDGRGGGDNAKAAFIVRSLNEMMRLGDKMGIAPETFIGLAGMGDAIVTCISKHSRNRNTGELIGKGLSVDEAVASCNMVVEGIGAIKSIYRLSKQYNVGMPIISELYSIIYQGKDATDSVSALMARELKSERNE